MSDGVYFLLEIHLDLVWDMGGSQWFWRDALPLTILQHHSLQFVCVSTLQV